MTDNHQYETPAAGTLDWDEPLNRNFERIDTDVEIRDVDANRSNYVAKAGAKFLATDTGNVYVGESGAWNQLGTIGAGSGSGDGGITSLLLSGSVVALGRNLTAPRAIDPADTATPIQDAIDVVGSAGGGEVRLPAGVVEETGPIRPYEDTQITGFGVEISKVSITDRDADGILFDRDSGTSRVLLDGFALNGPAGTGPTGVAIHHTNRDTQDLSVGRLVLWGWNNSVYRVDESVGPFQCRHDQLTIYECDAGDQEGLFEFNSWYGPANWFGTIAAYPSATASGSNTTVFYSKGGTQHVEYLTMGGSAGIAIDQTWDSLLEFGNVHWEPTTNPTSPPAIVRLRGHGTAIINSVKHVTGTADYAYELGYDSYNGRGPNRKLLGPYIELGQDASIGSNVVNLAHPVDATEPSMYFGAPGDVDVTHSEGSTGGFRALGTAGTGF